MYHYIYKIEFLKGCPNRYYIGKRTSEAEPSKDNYYRGSGRFCKSFFDKYGTDGTYRKIILEINSSKEINSEREKYWISNLWKEDPLCMNQCAGGMLGGAKEGIDKNGEKNPFYGKTHKKSTKLKMAETKQKWKTIGCYSKEGVLIKEYYSTEEIKNDGYSMKCVWEVLAQRNKTHKKKIFKILN